jgi:phosphoglycerate kinase
MLGSPVRKLDEAMGRDTRDAVAGLQDGDLLLLENLRFYPGEGANDADFAHELAELCGVYCNDAFATANLALASKRNQFSEEVKHANERDSTRTMGQIL